jgi:AmiR/NasT family two-component response regulator
VAAVVAPPLQESSKLPIPVRMSQLSSENQRLRDELDALEKTLKSPLD